MNSPDRRLAIIGGLAALAVATSACGGTSAAGPGWTYGPAGPTVAATAAGSAAASVRAAAAASVGDSASSPTNPIRVSLAIVTGDMIGKTEYPAFVPSDVSLPANSTVTVTITNFDDATPLPKGAEQFAAVSGTVGDVVTVTPIDLKDPNGSGGPTSIVAKLALADVSHTFTVPGLGLNVPIPAHSRTTFTFQTHGAGSYAWHCMDPCGAGPTGWGTAMAARSGYMQGTLTIG